LSDRASTGSQSSNSESSQLQDSIPLSTSESRSNSETAEDDLGSTETAQQEVKRSRLYSSLPINNMSADPAINQQQTPHQTMEFFEMCAKLITALAR